MGKISKSYLKDKYLSTKGYKRNSPDVNNPYNIIPSNQITMRGVDFPVLGVDNFGNRKLMKPGSDYTFPGNYVKEFPLRNMGNNRFQTGGAKSPVILPQIDYDLEKAPKQGNFLLSDIDRPFYIDDDGEKRSEYRMGINVDGKETLIPTVVNGVQLTDDQATQRYFNTGLHMGQYNTVPEAEYASRMRTLKYNMLEDPVRFGTNYQAGGTKKARPIVNNPPKTKKPVDPRQALFLQSTNVSSKTKTEQELDRMRTAIKNAETKPAPVPVSNYYQEQPTQDNLRTEFYKKSDTDYAAIEAAKAAEREAERLRLSGVIRETTDADREAQNRRDYTLLGRAESLNRGSFNPLTVAAAAADYLNPAYYYYTAKDIGRGLGQTAEGIYNLDEGQVGSGLLQTGASALAAAPSFLLSPKSVVKPLSKYLNLSPVQYRAIQTAVNNPATTLTTKTPLKDTYRLNPWAFKPNTSSAYRMIGSGEDLLNSRVVRPNQTAGAFDPLYKEVFPETYYSVGVPLDNRNYSFPLDFVNKTEYKGHIRPYNIKGNNVTRKWGMGAYEGPYMVEVPNYRNSPHFDYSNVGNRHTQVLNKKQPLDFANEITTKVEVPVTDVNLYKQHWLKGYKPVDVPTKLSGLPSSKSSIAKSADMLLVEGLGELFKGQKNRAAIAKGNEWLKNWINSSTTQAKIETDLGWIPQRGNIYKDIYDLGYEQAKNFVPNTKEYPLLNQVKELQKNLTSSYNKPHIHFDNIGVSYLHGYNPFERYSIEAGKTKPLSNRYESYISRDPSISQKQRMSTTIHEGTHDWVSDYLLKESGQETAIRDVLPNNIKELTDKWSSLRDKGVDPSTQMTKQEVKLGYLGNPAEVHARIMELRKHFGMTPEYSKNLTSEQASAIMKNLKSAPKTSPIDLKFFDVIDNNPDNLASLFRRLWAVPATTAIGAGAYQQYNQQPKGTYQMGGTIGITGVNGQVVSSGPQPLSSVKKTRGSVRKDNKGNVKTMSPKAVNQVLKYSKQKPNKI